MDKVKVIHGSEPEELENQVNKWLADNPNIRIVSINPAAGRSWGKHWVIIHYQF